MNCSLVRSKLFAIWHALYIFIDLPKEGPQIRGRIQDEYEIGDILTLACTSSKSFPPARLSWYINDVPVIYFHVYFIYIAVHMFSALCKVS